MKLIIAAVLLSISTIVSAADMQVQIVRVIDGDTISTLVPLPCPLCRVSIRILGIDTPESNYQAKCIREKTLGIEAKEYVKTLVGDIKIMTVRNIKWDKYGGRINGDVEVGGVDIGKTLIEKGYARPYDGGKKSDWCN
jgi:micrococcal nuclease